jgi:DNA-binding beta-propeller fold protein YncE
MHPWFFGIGCITQSLPGGIQSQDLGFRAAGLLGPFGHSAALRAAHPSDTFNPMFQLKPVLARICVLSTALFLFHSVAAPQDSRSAKDSAAKHHFLYVATPGIRDYLEYGGHGILVFDIDHEHKFVKRLPCGGLDEKGKPLNVKGICASARTQRLYVSTTRTLMSFDLRSGRQLWEKAYEGGCDRLAISPDGKIIYLPSLEQGHWHVVDALSGKIIKKVVTNSGAHNTIIGPDGRFAYLAGLKSPLLRVTDTRSHDVVREVGPFSNVIRPFTINGSQTLCYVNVNELLGFEIGDLNSGKMVHRVEVKGFERGPTKRHGCPSHGIGLTPDEKEIWLADSFNSRIHLFDNTAQPPKQKGSIELRDQPGWITFSIDGRYAYPSTGDVIEVATHKVIAVLTDENHAAVQSEKLLEIDFDRGRAIRAGNQFGIGGVQRGDPLFRASANQ